MATQEKPASAVLDGADEEAQSQMQTPPDDRQRDEQPQDFQQAPPVPPSEVMPPPVGRRAPVPQVESPDLNDDPNARHEAAYQGVQDKVAKQFAQEHPFLPSGWTPGVDPNGPEVQRAEMQSDQDLIARRRQAMQEAQQRRQQIGQENDQLEAQMRGTGQRFFKDSQGQVQPIIDPSGRPLYEPSRWEEGTHPKTGEPTLTMRDQYGQRQYRRPPIVASPDLTDDQIYYRMPSGEMKAAGNIDALAKHPDFQVQKLALRSATVRTAAKWKAAIVPFEQEKLLADQQHAEALTQQEGLKAALDEANTKMAGITDPAQQAAAQAQIDQLQANLNQLGAAVKPGGQLFNARRDAAMRLGLLKAKAQYDAHAAQTQEILARIKAQGGDPETDPALLANLQGQETFANAIRHYGAIYQQSQAGQAAEDGAAPQVPGVTPVPVGEPVDVFKQGIGHIGNIPIQDFARLYGADSAKMSPDANALSLLRIRERAQGIQSILDSKDQLAGTQTDPQRLADEQTYLNQLYAQRFAKLSPEDQEKLNNVIAHQTTTTAGAFGRTVGEQVTPTAAMVAGAEIGAGSAEAALGPLGLPTAGVVPAVAGIVGGLVGGMGGYWAGSKAQKFAFQKLFPNAYNEFTQYQATDWDQHPFAVQGGQLAATATSLGFASPKAMAPGVEGILKLVRGKATEPAERIAAGQLAKQLAKQVGMGATVGALDPLLHGEKPTPGGVADSILQFLVFGEPRFHVLGHGGAARPGQVERPDGISEEQWAAIPEETRAMFAQQAEQAKTAEPQEEKWSLREAVLEQQRNEGIPRPMEGPPKSAAESAEVFEPALTEQRLGAKPPEKSARESAEAFQKEAKGAIKPKAPAPRLALPAPVEKPAPTELEAQGNALANARINQQVREASREDTMQGTGVDPAELAVHGEAAKQVQDEAAAVKLISDHLNMSPDKVRLAAASAGITLQDWADQIRGRQQMGEAPRGEQQEPGPKIDPKDLAITAAHLGITPEELAAKMKGTPPEEPPAAGKPAPKEPTPPAPAFGTNLGSKLDEATKGGNPNAIQEQSPGAVPVRQASANGEGVGRENQVNQEPAGARQQAGVGGDAGGRGAGGEVGNIGARGEVAPEGKGEAAPPVSEAVTPKPTLKEERRAALEEGKEKRAGATKIGANKDGQTLYQDERGTPPSSSLESTYSRPMPVAEVQAAVDTFAKENPQAPKFEIVNRPDWMENGRGVRGQFENGKLTINAAYATDAATVHEIANHEWAHDTLATEPGKRAMAVFAKRELPAADMADLAKRYPRQEGENIADHTLRLAEEWVAKNAEKQPGIWGRVVDSIKGWLAKHGMATLTNEQAARAMIRSLREANGKSGSEAPARSSLAARPEEDAQMDKLVDAARSAYQKRFPNASPESVAKLEKSIRDGYGVPRPKAPTEAQTAKINAPGAMDEIRRIFAPQTRGPVAAEAARTLREHGAELAQRTDRANASLEAGRSHIASLPKAQREAFIDAIEAGQKQADPKLQPFADTMRTILDTKRDEIQALGTGALDHFIEDYFPHIWENPERAITVLQEAAAKKPLEGSKSFLKHRTLPTTADGRKLGLKPVTDNPVDLMLLKAREMDKYITAHQTFQELKSKGMLTLVHAGEPAPAGYVKINDPIARIYGPRMGAVGLPEGAKEAGIKPGDVRVYGRRIMGEYYAPEAIGAVINNYLSPGLRGSKLFRGYLTAANSINQFQLGLSAFHLGFTSLDSAISRLAVGLEDVAHGDLGRAAKTIASTPAAPFTNAIRGNKVLREWARPGTQGDEIGRIVDGLKAAGGRAQMDRFYQTAITKRMMENFREGGALNYAKGVLRAPFAGIEQASKPILEWVVPRQKLGVFADLARRELDRLGPNASRDQVREAMGKAWDSVDNRLGQIVYDNLFWKKTAKDLGMASIRSLGWNLGTLREIGGGAVDTLAAGKALAKGQSPEMTHRMAYMVAMPILTGTIGAITQYMLTGKGPEEERDYFFPKTGEKDPQGRDIRLALPSYMKDIYHYAHDPVGTVSGKVHPIISAGATMLSNKDYFDRPIRNADDPLIKQILDIAGYTAKQFAPIGISQAVQANESHQAAGEQAANFVGVTRAAKWVSMSPAERLAEKLNGAHLGTASTPTPGAEHRYETKRDLLGQLRNGTPQEKIAAARQVNQLVASGELTQQAAKQMLTGSKQSYLTNQLIHLDASEALRVFSAASIAERKAISTQVAAKISRAQIPVADKKDMILRYRKLLQEQ